MNIPIVQQFFSWEQIETIVVGCVVLEWQARWVYTVDFCLVDLILYVPSTIFQLCRDGCSWVEPVLS